MNIPASKTSFSDSLEERIRNGPVSGASDRIFDASMTASGMQSRCVVMNLFSERSGDDPGRELSRGSISASCICTPIGQLDVPQCRRTRDCVQMRDVLRGHLHQPPLRRA